MITTTQPVPLYHRGESLCERVFDALGRNGKDTHSLAREDVGGIDEFHPGGREATRDLARLAGLTRGMEVLDLGCGLGGPARTLHAEIGCRLTGVDHNEEYLDLAEALSEATRMGGEVQFHQGDALDLPFADRSFDVVWVQHAAVQVEDKPAMLAEVRRVLRGGGRLALYEPWAGPNASPRHFPVPWTDTESGCYLVSPEDLRAAVQAEDLECFLWEDRSRVALRSVHEALGGGVFIHPSDPPPLGLNLVVSRAAERRSNLTGDLEEDRLRVVQGVFLAR